MYQDILRVLHSGHTLSHVKGLGKIGDRWDLRGITLPVRFVARNSAIVQVDFSHAVLREVQWERCRFQDVLFHKVDADGSKFWTCEFDHVDFIESRLLNSLMSGALDYVHGCSYRRVRFVKNAMLATVYTKGLFEQCEFSNCKLGKVSFDECRFIDTGFKGKLKEIFFRGAPPVNPMTLPPVKVPPHRMERVDFREAYMESVEFLDGIDLTSCLFPEGDDYMIIRNRERVFEEARRIVETTWEGVEQRGALMLIDYSYLSERKKGQPLEFMDRHYLMNNNGWNGLRFFELIRELNENISDAGAVHQQPPQDNIKTSLFSKVTTWFKVQ